MDRSFSRQTPAIPKRNQFAGGTAKSHVDLRDTAARRRYIEEQERAFVPFERLASLHQPENDLEDVLNERRLEQERELRQQEYDWNSIDHTRSDTYERQVEEAYSSSDISDKLDRLEEELSAIRRKQPAGEYHDSRSHQGATYGEVMRHVGRQRLGPYQEDRQAEQEEQRVRARQRELYRSYAPGVHMSDRLKHERSALHDELSEMEAALQKLRSGYENRVHEHRNGIIDAAYRRGAMGERSHVAKPVRPRQDGKTIRRWNET